MTNLSTTPDSRLNSANSGAHCSDEKRPAEEGFGFFCAGNRLPERFASAQQFCITELGFGSGLRFLQCAQLWRDTAPAQARLHYIAIEPSPLTAAALAAALAPYHALQTLREALLQHYPSSLRGWHRLHLAEQRIHLSLLFDTASSALPQLDSRSDAWFLGAIAPTSNPPAWPLDVFRQINRLSADAATLASDNLPQPQQCDLVASGFSLQHETGLVGQLQQRLPHRNTRTPWFAAPAVSTKVAAVSIIGAGITGCALANRLAARGIAVTLIERENAIASAASSNPCAIVHPYFTRDHNLTAQLAQQGFLYTLQTLRRLTASGLAAGFHAAGMVLQPKSAKDRQRQQQIAAQNDFLPAFAQWHEAAALSRIAGTTLGAPGWFIPQGGWVSLPQLCRALLAEHAALITLQSGCEIHDLEPDTTHGGWILQRSDGQPALHAEVVVASNAHAMQTFAALSHLPLTANRGQTEYLRAEAHGLITSLSGEGYCLGIDADHLCIGSSYERDNPHPALRRADREASLGKFSQLAGALAAQRDTEVILDWSEVRTTLPDRLPLLGRVARVAEFTQTFAPMFRGERRREYPTVPLQPALWAFTGVGSRAVAYTLLCAEILASEINAEPLPVSRKLREALDANRFLVRPPATANPDQAIE